MAFLFLFSVALGLFVCFHVLMIINPIIRGFNPDPSICYDGQYYWLVTSTFEYFPAVSLYCSKDLSEWQHVRNIIDDSAQLDLSGCDNSSGIYAVTIRFNRGRYYIITTNKKTDDNFIMWTDDVLAKWKGPFMVRNGGIDSSLFFDDDGRCFYCSNGEIDGKKCILGAWINPDTGRLEGEVRLLSEGISQHATEAPHIYKRKGWYYLAIAEGGTSFGHHENILRSKDIFGPYEGYGNNPILGHLKRKGHPFQCLGHADLIDTGDDKWLAVFLGVRVTDRSLNYNLGRETFMAPVTWTNDDWPIIGNNGFIDEEMECSFVDMKQPYREKVFYENPLFPQKAFNLRSNRVRRFDEKNGTLVEGKEYICTEHGEPAIFLCRQSEFEEECSVGLYTDEVRLKGSAGITVWLGNHYNIILRLFRKDGDVCYEVERNVHDLGVVVKRGVLGSVDRCRLAIRADREFYRLFIDDMEAGRAATANMSSSATMYMNFTGTLFGLFAEQGSAIFFNPAWK